jgi:hypothetical protein
MSNAGWARAANKDLASTSLLPFFLWSHVDNNQHIYISLTMNTTMQAQPYPLPSTTEEDRLNYVWITQPYNVNG